MKYLSGIGLAAVATLSAAALLSCEQGSGERGDEYDEPKGSGGNEFGDVRIVATSLDDGSGGNTSVTIVPFGVSTPAAAPMPEVTESDAAMAADIDCESGCFLTPQNECECGVNSNGTAIGVGGAPSQEEEFCPDICILTNGECLCELIAPDGVGGSGPEPSSGGAAPVGSGGRTTTGTAGGASGVEAGGASPIGQGGAPTLENGGASSAGETGGASTDGEGGSATNDEDIAALCAASCATESLCDTWANTESLEGCSIGCTDLVARLDTQASESCILSVAQRQQAARDFACDESAVTSAAAATISACSAPLSRPNATDLAAQCKAHCIAIDGVATCRDTCINEHTYTWLIGGPACLAATLALETCEPQTDAGTVTCASTAGVERDCILIRPEE